MDARLGLAIGSLFSYVGLEALGKIRPWLQSDHRGRFGARTDYRQRDAIDGFEDNSARSNLALADLI
jgi:hypothetical protein